MKPFNNLENKILSDTHWEVQLVYMKVLNATHQPSLHLINGFKQISKRWFYQFNCRFPSKIDFWFFKSFINISGYLSLKDFFRFILRQLRMGHVINMRQGCGHWKNWKFLLQNDQFFFKGVEIYRKHAF